MKIVFEKMKKYNVWEGMHKNNGFIRQTYIDKISDYFDNTLVKVFVGQIQNYYLEN